MSLPGTIACSPPDIPQNKGNRPKAVPLILFILSLLEKADNFIIIFRAMHEGASGAYLNPSAAGLLIGRMSGAFLPGIEGAVAKQAIQLLNTFVAGIIPALPVLKETI